MRKQKPFCCWVLIVLVTIGVVIYAFQSVKFNSRVKMFNNLKIGTKLMDIYILFGEPSKKIYGLGSSELLSFWQLKVDDDVTKEKKFIVIIYKGIKFLRKDIILFFDMDNEELIHKERRFELKVGDVVYRNPFGLR
jgi:hypothetical protein